MSYKVSYTALALKQLKKLDASTRTMILAYVKKNLDGCENPRALGAALTGQFAGMWRYRVGSYRLLSRIISEEVIIDIIKLGHHGAVYRN
jgi:mRNA interferase RelE/StbE